MNRHFRLLCLPHDGWDKPPIVLHETKGTGYEEFATMIDKLPYSCERLIERVNECFVDKGPDGYDFYKIEMVEVE